VTLIKSSRITTYQSSLTDPKFANVTNLTDAYKVLGDNDLPMVPDRIDPKSVKHVFGLFGVSTA